MSLRDQLLRAGVVDRKQKQAAERELKRQRKLEQAARGRKKDLERAAMEQAE